MTFNEEELVISVQKYPLLYDMANTEFRGKNLWNGVQSSLFGSVHLCWLFPNLVFCYIFFSIRLRLRLLQVSNNIFRKTTLVFGRHISKICTDEMMTAKHTEICTLFNVNAFIKIFLRTSLCKNLHKPLF